MKAKLLSLVCPLPASAILAADFEVFRESIYTVRAVEAVVEPEPFLPSPAGNNMCSWCGIWQPLPSPHTYSTGEQGNQPTVATNVAVAAESDPGELGNQPTVATLVAVAAVLGPDKNKGTIANLGELSESYEAEDRRPLKTSSSPRCAMQ